MAQNTTQGNNGAIYAGNFIMQANAPLDDRTVVASKDKLLEFNDYVYNGMLVVTLDNNELYQLVDVTKKSNYEGWKQVSTDTEDLERRLNEKADKTAVEESERVVSEALNLLKTLIDENKALIERNKELIDENTKKLENQLNLYEQEVTSGNSVVIDKSTHNCGNYPSVTVYYDNTVAYSNIEVDINGKLTISWSITPTVEKPIRIILVGKN